MERPALARDRSASTRSSTSMPNAQPFHAFAYDRLRAPEHEIRVIKLEPSYDINAPLRCSIETWRDRQEGRYRTLSYTWGSSGPVRSLYCSSSWSAGHIGITANLDRALRRLRAMVTDQTSRALTHSPTEYLWIDAICINQSDTMEKSVQVEQMSWTYRDAAATSIYLGDFENDKDARNVQEFLAQNAESTERISAMMDMTLASKLNSFSSLLQAPWFQRRWVIQETFQPRLETTELMFNHVVVSLANFRSLLIATGKETEGGPIPLRPGLNESTVLRGLLELLNQFEDSLCGNPRDKIYALLGISYEAVLLQDTRLKVDYKIDPSDLSLNLAEMYAAKEEWLVPLLLSASCRNGAWKSQASSSFWLNRNKRGLPSWVPDWQQPPEHVSPNHREATAWRNGHFCTLGAARECQTFPPPAGHRHLPEPPVCRLQTRARPTIVRKSSGMQLQLNGIVLLGCSGAVRLRDQLWSMALDGFDPFSARCRHGYSECVSSWLSSVSASKAGARLKNFPRNLESNQALLLLEKRFSSSGRDEEGHNVSKAFVLQTSDGGSADFSSTFLLHSAFDCDRIAKYITFPKRRWITIV